MQKNSKIRIICNTAWQNINFKELSQISNIHKNGNDCTVYLDFLDQPLLPYKFHGSIMRGILFFNFASCELYFILAQNEKTNKQTNKQNKCIY